MRVRRAYTLLLGSILSLLLITGCNRQSRQNKPLSPNIFFAIADDASYEHMSAYGCTWVKTPAFDRVASEGILFTNAYTPNAKCAPSRSCILTGRNSWQLEAAANHGPHFPAKFKTYAEALKDHGYAVGYTGKGWSPGNPGKIDGKRRELAGRPFNDKKLTPPTPQISNIDYVANFSQFLDNLEDDKPFCFWYGGREPHRRYAYGSGIALGQKTTGEIGKVYPFWPDNDTVRTDMLDYAYEVEYFDAQLGKMLDLLEEQDMLGNTVVVVTSDNGMPFPRIKGQEYEYSNHLPLAIMWKNELKKPGRVVDDLVSFIDFAPTFLELAGLGTSASGMQPVQGKSLTDILYADKEGVVNPDRNYLLIGKERHDVGRPGDAGYPIRGIVKDGYLYLHNFRPDRWPAGNPETGYLNTDGSPTKTMILNRNRRNPGDSLWQRCFGKRWREEFYRIATDPACMFNLADSSQYADLKEDLKQQLFNELKAQNDPQVLGKGEVFDNHEYASGKTRDYYNRFMKGELTEKAASWVNVSDFEKKDRTDEGK